MSHVVIPSSAPLHSVQGDGFRKTYYSSIQVNRSQEYRWKVYLGDVVAFSTEPALSLAGIEKWEPKHYQKASPHWKIGLVVGLAQVASPKSINFECSVQLLEKLLDNSSATKKLRKTLRPWRKSSATNDTCQTPHLLLKSNKFETIDPLKLLPVTITMMEREEFKQGVQIGSEESLSLKFHCSKSISEDGSDIINEEPKADEWALLNSSSSSFSMDALHIPKPLQEAWPKWSVIQEKPALLNHLINGFRKAIKEKRKAFKEKQNVYNHEKRRAVLENQPDNKEVDVNDASAVKTNKRKEAGSGKDGSNSKKRIRIQLPNEVPEDKTPFKPQPSTSTNKKALPSIMKNKSTNSSKSTRKQNSESNNKKQPASFTARRQARSVNNKAKATTAKTTPKTKAKATPKAKAKPSMKVQAPKKGKTLSKQECGTPSTADTNSTDEAMPSRGRRKTILSNAKPTFQLQISPLSESVLTQKHDGQQSDFYESVEIAIDKNVFKKRIVPKSKTFRIAVGNMLAVRSDDSIARTWTPFGIKWGVAQLVAIYKVKSNKEWMMDVRWFYRHREIKESNRSRLGDFSKSRGLLEKTEVYTCPLESALPAYVILTSEGGKTRVGQLPTVCKEDGLPIIYFLCQHLQKGKRVVNVKDWNNYHKSIASIPDSLTRGLVNEAVNSSLADIYKALISQRVCVDPEEGTDDEPSSASDEEMEEPNPLAVVPLTPQPILERWGKKFYDGIRLDIDQNSLSSDFCPTTKQWTLKVGYIIPIYCEHESLSNYGGKSKCWYPFVASWSAGQVVSIYRTESGEWMMQIRWFHRFFELNDGQKSGLKSLDKAHIVFETEEYTHLPVTSAFPGRVVLTSCDTDDWEIATSLVAGLPLIPRLCAYMCLDDDIDISMDWTNYDIDLNSKSVPVPLVRGLLLAPTHRENKEWILTLSRYYRKYITLRGSDPNEEVFRKWQSKGEKPLSIKYEGPIRFEPRDVNMLCSHLLETASSPSREFFRNLKNTAPVKYIASPLKKMKRMKKHSFSCNVGDIVCFYDANAKNKTDHILMKNMKHPWYPFQVSWSFGQVLSIYRDSTGGSDNIPCVEIRRLYRASELPMAVQVFLPSIEDNEREEVFETDDIIEKLPASSLLGTADIYLGQYKTGANEEDISRPISIASCRCRFFYLTAYQRLQPLFSSGFSHQIWFRRFQGRGLQLSRMVKKFKSLGESMAIPLPTGKNPLDIRILLGENRNAGKSTTTGVCKARALPQENASQRRLFADALIPPQWSTFDCCDLFYDQEDQRLDWKVEIGDFVATRNATPKEGSWYPFREPWIPCQVLAIYSDGDKEKHDSVSLESLQFELGILQMKSSGSAEMGLAEIGECNPPRTKIMGAVDLLGPLSLYHRGVQCNVDSDKAHLPWAVCRASETLSSELTTKSLGISSVYSKTDITNVLQKLGGNQKLKPSRSEDKTHSMHNVVRKSGDAWTSVAPSYVDLSRYRAYYTELNLIPPHKCSSDKNNRSDRTPWVVRMGDIVMINCDGAKRSPMECNWGGKIVSIEVIRIII